MVTFNCFRRDKTHTYENGTFQKIIVHEAELGRLAKGKIVFVRVKGNDTGTVYSIPLEKVPALQPFKRLFLTLEAQHHTIAPNTLVFQVSKISAAKKYDEPMTATETRVAEMISSLATQTSIRAQPAVRASVGRSSPTPSALPPSSHTTGVTKVLLPAATVEVLQSLKKRYRV